VAKTRFFANRASRVLAIWALVLVQAQLLWVAELHRHGEDALCRISTVLAREEQDPGAGAAQPPFCIACRIAQESAAHPAAGFLETAPGAVIHSHPSHEPRPVQASPSCEIPARAPPSR
jgi:hypothetical protein